MTDDLIRHSMHLRAEDVAVSTAAHGHRLVLTAGRARVAISGDTTTALQAITRRAAALTHPTRCAACDTRLAAGDTHDHPDWDRPVCWTCCPDCHTQETP